MTIFHFVNCAALCFGPHLIYYKATPLSEYVTWPASLRAAVVYLATMLIKMILWASLLHAGEEEASDGRAAPFDAKQEALKAALGMLADVAGLYYALVHVSYRSISFEHKFQAVGLGWSLASTVTGRLLPLWFGAAGMEFQWTWLREAAQSNVELLLTVCLAALGSLLWLRRSKPPMAAPLIYAAITLIAAMPFYASFLERGHGWEATRVACVEVGGALAAAVVTWRIYVACARQNAAGQ